MFRIKRLYTFILQTFLPLFVMTFGICLFIVLMQFLWKYIDDMVGKGLELKVLGEMFFYAALTLVPMALPLAILLASLMAFGNLGERLELLAMKSAGVSLVHIMRPLIFTIGIISIGAFFFQNNAMPVAQVKMVTLLYSMRQKSPELDIPERVFYNEIAGYSLYVKKKEPDGLLKDIMIYDYSKGYQNALVMVADSGRLKTSADKLFLVLTLFEGESFSNLETQTTSSRRNQEAVRYNRETFQSKEILIEFDANFSRTDEGLFQEQYGKNIKDLQHSIDTLSNQLDSMNRINATAIYETSYRKSLPKKNAETDSVVLAETPKTGKKGKQPEPVISFNYDSIFNSKTPGDKAGILNRARQSVDYTKTEYFFKANTAGSTAFKMRRYQTEWHRKFTLSFACIVFFFIGAPLGAIIRKGGLGVPVIISVILFIFYYIIDNIGFKMAREGVWMAWQGMWLSSFILAPLGVFLTYKAVNDSVVLNPDTYLNFFKNLFGKRTARKIDKKEVIMFTPAYESMLPQLQQLTAASQDYLSGHKRWLNYLAFWKQGGKDQQAEEIAKKMEEIIEELSNSDQNLILNKLMDYPQIGGYNQSRIQFKGKLGLITGLFFPLGLPIYFIATYQRKLLKQDIQTIAKVSDELQGILKGFIK